MPRKKKIVSDASDALEILREAFSPYHTKKYGMPRFAELGKKPRIRLVAAKENGYAGEKDPYLENPASGAEENNNTPPASEPKATLEPLIRNVQEGTLKPEQQKKTVDKKPSGGALSLEDLKKYNEMRLERMEAIPKPPPQPSPEELKTKIEVAARGRAEMQPPAQEAKILWEKTQEEPQKQSVEQSSAPVQPDRLKIIEEQDGSFSLEDEEGNLRAGSLSKADAEKYSDPDKIQELYDKTYLEEDIERDIAQLHRRAPREQTTQDMVGKELLKRSGIKDLTAKGKGFRVDIDNKLYQHIASEEEAKRVADVIKSGKMPDLIKGEDGPYRLRNDESAAEKERVAALHKKAEDLHAQKSKLSPEDQKRLYDLTAKINAQFETQSQEGRVPATEATPIPPDADKQALEVLQEIVSEESRKKPEPPMVSHKETPVKVEAATGGQAEIKAPEMPQAVPDLGTPSLEEVEKQLSESMKTKVGAPEKAVPTGRQAPEPPLAEIPKPELKKSEAAKAKEAKNLKPEGIRLSDLPPEEQEKAKVEAAKVSFEEKTKLLLKEIDSPGGWSREKGQEVLARQLAREKGYSAEAIQKSIDELRSREKDISHRERRMVGRLGLAKKLIEEELGATTKTEEKKEETKRRPYTINETGDIELEKSEYAEVKETAVGKAFSEKFGITAEELARMEGFRDLSDGQQLLVLRNLDQLTRGRIEEEAATIYKEGTQHSKFLGRIFRGVTEGITGKEYKTLAAKKQTEEAIRTGGIALHGAHLAWLTKMAKNTPVEVKEDGSLEINYIYPDTFGPDGIQVAKAYNTAATKFSTIPLAWSWDTATNKQQKEFVKLEKQYQEAREALETLFAKDSNIKAASLFVHNLDNAVKMNQLLNANPELETALQQVDSKRTWKEFAKGVGKSLSEKGAFAGAGYVTRYATISLFGLAAAPAAAGVIKGIRSTMKGAENFREEKKLRRNSTARKEKAGMDKELLGKKDFVDAENLNGRIEFLLEKINTDHVPTRHDRHVEHLDKLLQYTHAKLKDGYINFGTKDKNLQNQFELLTNLSKAQGYLFMHLNNTGAQDKQDKMVAKALELHKRRVSGEKRKYLAVQFGKGALIGASFAAGGWITRHLMEENGFFSKAAEAAKDTAAPPENLPLKPEIEPTPVLPAEKAAKAPAWQPLEKQTPQWEPLDNADAGTGRKGLPAWEPAEKASDAISAAEKTMTLSIAARGPEGTLIDELQNNAKLAKEYGWDGTSDIKTWAGGEAHRMWLEHAHKAVKNPDVLNQMKKLGYLKGLSKTQMEDEDIVLGRYKEMMLRIKKGSTLSFDPAKKLLDFSKVLFSKAPR